jgi:hypothetical protein
MKRRRMVSVAGRFIEGLPFSGAAELKILLSRRIYYILVTESAAKLAQLGAAV